MSQSYVKVEEFISGIDLARLGPRAAGFDVQRSNGIEDTGKRLTAYWTDYMNQFAVDTDEPDTVIDE